eukprot:Skav207114  [mRNA]  locus=scaffold156:226696:227526:- [translate_table: standard]
MALASILAASNIHGAQVCLPGALECGRVRHRVGLRHRGLVGGRPGEDGLQAAHTARRAVKGWRLGWLGVGSSTKQMLLESSTSALAARSAKPAAPVAMLRPRYQMAMEDAQLKHGDETQPIENPEAHLKAYRESVKIMKLPGMRSDGVG